MLFKGKDEPSIIKIVGVGGGGSNAVTYMFNKGIVGVDYAICNTDTQAMNASPVPTKIPLGEILTEGRGAGNKPTVGKQAGLESQEAIRKYLEKNTKMVFITAGMGGGTGTGAAPIIAKVAQELGILTVAIVTTPFSFEGRTRVGNGSEGLAELRENVDCMVVISNDKVREMYGNLSMSAAFSKADDILCTAAKGIAEIITVAGYMNVDFADVNTVMRGSGVAIMGTATAGGENRALQAVDEALHCPLLEENNIRGAKNILLNFTSGLKEVTMDEINIITNFIQREAGDDANLIWGTCFDDRLGENLTVTVIATGFEGRDNHRSLTDIFKLRNPISANDRNVVRLDEASERPSLYAITQDQAYTTVEEKPANAIEFEFDDIRRTVDGIRRKTSTDPFIGEDASDLAPEERRKRIEEMQKKQEEALNRPITVAKLTSPQTVIDLENQPAYQRKNVNLDDVQDAQQTTLSGWTINLEDEKVITQKDNAFLHKKQD